MNILITGVTSFIGRALAKELISEGYEVYGLIRPESQHKTGLPAKVHTIECGAGHPEELLDKKLPELFACVCLAWGATSKEKRMDPEAHHANIDNTLALFPVLRELGCRRVVMAGSQAEYGVTADDPAESPVTESRMPAPVSEYGKAKLEILNKGSKLCAELGMVYIHARIFSTYGYGDNPHSLVSSCVTAFRNGESIELTPCSQMWNYIYIDDCAKALADLVGCVFPVPEDAGPCDYAVNVASGRSAVLSEFVKEIHEVIGKGSYSLKRQEHPAEGTPFLYPDITKLKELTGFRETVTFREGIEKMTADMSQPEKD